MAASRSDWRALLAVAGALLWLVSGSTGPAQAQSSPVLKANFHTLGVYWTRLANAQGVAIRYRSTGSTTWLKGQALWRDDVAPLAAFKGQYRGSIVNLIPNTAGSLRFDPITGARSNRFPRGRPHNEFS